ncbi:two-component system sensor histidine kinase DesK [Actinocorallia herbida]|uniref:Two-component system sensor histidine kinase DesK n=1 Tax=Actinocorallia herbida TaxID=58109 RepID=A0A3N1D775_9ACTN|nr:histidine kinase [Actinocorallia herbida]ROO89383.1 two-component system sensor histidine kinase DesK [Actinocorallia herbida]
MRPRLPRETTIVGFVVALSTVATCGLFVQGVAGAIGEAVSGGPLRPAAGGTAAALLVVVLQGGLMWQSATRQIGARSRIALAVVAAVCFALPPLLGPAWNAGMLAVGGMLAVTLPERLSVPLAAAAAFLAGGITLATGADGLQAVIAGLGLPIAGLSAYATVWLCLAVGELRDARAELARSAVGEERIRFARDLHDVLGHSLQAVALRAELAERLLPRDPDRVARELAEIQAMARGAVQEMREVVRGYRITSLRTELDGATAVLRAAGIDCEGAALPADLPRHVHETLGWVAREAVTNVLRHSGATRCAMAVRTDGARAELEIVNDGARRTAGAGSGLAGLRERLAAVGGALQAGPADGGEFRVLATVPLKEAQ